MKTGIEHPRILESLTPCTKKIVAALKAATNV